MPARAMYYVLMSNIKSLPNVRPQIFFPMCFSYKCFSFKFIFKSMVHLSNFFCMWLQLFFFYI